jgi:hypothetical protein
LDSILQIWALVPNEGVAGRVNKDHLPGLGGDVAVTGSLAWIALDIFSAML